MADLKAGSEKQDVMLNESSPEVTSSSPEVTNRSTEVTNDLTQ